MVKLGAVANLRSSSLRSTSVGRVLMVVVFATFFIGLSLPFSTLAITPVEGLKLFGDFRTRYDMDDRDYTGITSPNDERERMRYRLRFGFVYTPEDVVEFGVRLTSHDSIWSTHQVLGDTTGFDRDGIRIDKAYIKGKYKGGFVWFGKESIPFWTPGVNKWFLDDDINPEGIALGYKLDFEPVSVTLQGGHFVITDGGWGDADNKMNVYQVVAKAGIEQADITFAYGALTSVLPAGAYGGSLASISPADYYSQASIEAGIKPFPVPVTAGLDFMKSGAGDKETGYVLSVMVGKLKEAKDWRVGYSYQDIGATAASFYAEDDLPNLFADFKGHELFADYAILKNVNVRLRYNTAESKEEAYRVTRTAATGAISTAAEANYEESRARIDVNIKF